MTSNSDDSGTRAGLRIEVVYALPDEAHTAHLTLPTGSTVAQALALLADREPFAALDLQRLPAGIYGERVEASRVLSDGDRVELYRPLMADPREARRLRLER
jgi:putative ubiquitin-RnfH superfamily antitoxin RatB of RatAB toxin-antitoxin module